MIKNTLIMFLLLTLSASILVWWVYAWVSLAFIFDNIIVKVAVVTFPVTLFFSILLTSNIE